MLHHLKLARVEALERLKKEDDATPKTNIRLIAHKLSYSNPNQAVYKSKYICARAFSQLIIILCFLGVEFSTSLACKTKGLLAAAALFAQKIEGITITCCIFSLLSSQMSCCVGFHLIMFNFMIFISICNLSAFMVLQWPTITSQSVWRIRINQDCILGCLFHNMA